MTNTELIPIKVKRFKTALKILLTSRIRIREDILTKNTVEYLKGREKEDRGRRIRKQFVRKKRLRSFFYKKLF